MQQILEFSNLGKNWHILVQMPQIEKLMPYCDQQPRKPPKTYFFGKNFEKNVRYAMRTDN